MSDVAIYLTPYGDDCRHSRELLARAVSRHTGRSPGEIACTPSGKPYFPLLPDVHCSVSHSGDWWGCAVSDRSVGLDFQIHRSYLSPEKLSGRFFHPLEDRFLAGNGYTPFFDLWCAKESYVKFTGDGFFREPASFSVVSSGGLFPAVEGCELRILPFREEYSLCICAEALHEIRFLTL